MSQAAIPFRADNYLTEDQVAAYLKAKKLYPEDAELVVEDLHAIKESIDGYVNLIYHIYDQNGKSMVLKQIVNEPRSKMDEAAGSKNSKFMHDWSLDIGRLRSEIAVLIFWDSVYPGICPEIYLFDEQDGIIVMEDLTDHSLLRYEHSRMKKYPDFPATLGSFLARNLFYSSDLHLTRYKKQELEKFFENPEYTALDFFLFEDCTIVSDNRFMPEATWPLRKAIIGNETIQNRIRQMRHQFLTHKECLIHTDLHASNVMVNDHSIKIIDTEFAGFGPIAQDLGRLIASFCLNFFSWYGDETHTEGEKAVFRAYLLDSINALYQTFEAEFRELCRKNQADSYKLRHLDVDAYLLSLFRDTLCYTALNAASRIGDRGICYDFERLPSACRIYPEQLVLLLCIELFLNTGAYHSVTDLTDFLRGLAGKHPAQALNQE
ncbi:phosphotransferase [Eubacterium sp. 1001713B170207_170306_E7]|uniref:S-methyl-5-thioribose kinase n=1 Tax=Eubacterium sp. 1001713B170207_170306_E7 TaxID=2787097 RepID=UPI00189AFD4C|nr:phosphotransferase [Eubacterium sp. 1001713B170207_170306_E7]